MVFWDARRTSSTALPERMNEAAICPMPSSSPMRIDW